MAVVPLSSSTSVISLSRQAAFTTPGMPAWKKVESPTKATTFLAELLRARPETVKPPVRRMANEEEQAVKELIARRRQLIDMLTQEKNRLKRAEGRIKTDITKHIK